MRAKRGRPRSIPDSSIERIIELRQEGKTYRAIADQLNVEGVPTGSDGRWHGPTVYRALKTRGYLGACERSDEDRLAARLRRYSLTPVEFDRMMTAQGHACAICHVPFVGPVFSIDHDHECCQVGSCGRCVRGILCTACNTAIGKLGDDPDRLRSAAEYLEAAA